MRAKFNEQFKGELELSLNFVLPVKVNMPLKDTKYSIVQETRNLHSQISPVIKLYEPLLPRKYLTVYLIGTWNQILAGKQQIMKICEDKIGTAEMNKFFPYVTAQMCRHIVKNTAKFIHMAEKRNFYQDENDSPQKNYILKFWDFYTCEILTSEGTLDIAEMVTHLKKDADTLVCLMRLCRSEEELRLLLTKLKMSAEKAFQQSSGYFTEFSGRFNQKAYLPYSDATLLRGAYELIDMSENQELFEGDIHLAVSKSTQRLRHKSECKSFLMMPTSFGAHIRSSELPLDIETRLGNFFGNILSTKILRPSEHDRHQEITNCKVHPIVRDNADIIVGSYRHSRNLLYVIWADKAQKISLDSLNNSTF